MPEDDLWTAVWPRLTGVRLLLFESSSRAGTGWDGTGSGLVDVEQPDPDTVVWLESGTWLGPSGSAVSFSNSYRLRREGRSLGVSHLRRGRLQPVELVRLDPVGPAEPDQWRAAEPHLCGADRYDARLRVTQEAVLLDWWITGPAKDESLRYRYT